MSWIAVAVVGSNLIGGMMSSSAQSNAANTAAGAQTQAAQLGVDENRRQFQQVQALLSPFVNAGTSALGQQKNLLGLNGAGPQQAMIDQLQTMPAFTSALKLGENSILANASATGGLRGGNVQAALAQYSPQLLAQAINDQYNRLGGIVSLGQNAAAGVGNAGMATGSNISNLLQQSGAAQAGAALAGGRAQAGFYNQLGGALGTYAGMGGFGRQPLPDGVMGRINPYSGEYMGSLEF